MLENIEAILHDQCGLTKDRPVIAGISGGPDSMCLLGILRETGYRVIVAHFNHKLRSDADADANAVEQAASRMNFASVIESGDVREFASNEKLSLEEASRIMRYRFLMEQARRTNAQAVAVGHTADDQVETVLMHFIRGAGLAGLKGMSYRTIISTFDEEIPVVRPLLDTWREETVVYCAAHGFRPRHDPSNEIPALESYNPRFKDAVWRTSRSLTGDHEILSNVMDDAWKACIVQQTAEYVSFDSAALIKRPLGLQRNLIRRAIDSIHAGGLDVGFVTLERATKFINEETSRPRKDLIGGLYLLREGMLIYLLANTSDLPVERWPQMPDDSRTIPLKLPSSIPLSGGWKLTCERWNMASLAMDQARSNDDPYQVWLDASEHVMMVTDLNRWAWMVMR